MNDIIISQSYVTIILLQVLNLGYSKLIKADERKRQQYETTLPAGGQQREN
jgi:hypothetical protein